MDQPPEAAAAIPDPLRVLPPLTAKQGKCLQFILGYFLENRYYPTQRELAVVMGIQSNTAEMYLQPLEQKGYLMREPNKQRNIRLTQAALERLQLMGVNVQGLLVAA
jgi:DNA-binding MarR family transcriptional regulator